MKKRVKIKPDNSNAFTSEDSVGQNEKNVQAEQGIQAEQNDQDEQNVIAEKNVQDEQDIQAEQDFQVEQDARQDPPKEAEREKAQKSDAKPFIANTDNSYVTDINNPDMLIGPYKPKEGEPKTIKCPHCGEEMPTTIDTCVCCGHYLKEGQKKHYQPMDEGKAKKIRWIIGAVCIVAFIVWFILTKV